jgi:hypothetical protein
MLDAQAPEKRLELGARQQYAIEYRHVGMLDSSLPEKPLRRRMQGKVVLDGAQPSSV